MTESPPPTGGPLDTSADSDDKKSATEIMSTSGEKVCDNDFLPSATENEKSEVDDGDAPQDKQEADTSCDKTKKDDGDSDGADTEVGESNKQDGGAPDCVTATAKSSQDIDKSEGRTKEEIKPSPDDESKMGIEKVDGDGCEKQNGGGESEMKSSQNKKSVDQGEGKEDDTLTDIASVQKEQEVEKESPTNDDDAKNTEHDKADEGVKEGGASPVKVDGDASENKTAPGGVIEGKKLDKEDNATKPVDDQGGNRSSLVKDDETSEGKITNKDEVVVVDSSKKEKDTDSGENDDELESSSERVSYPENDKGKKSAEGEGNNKSEQLFVKGEEGGAKDGDGNPVKSDVDSKIDLDVMDVDENAGTAKVGNCSAASDESPAAKGDKDINPIPEAMNVEAASGTKGEDKPSPFKAQVENAGKGTNSDSNAMDIVPMAIGTKNGDSSPRKTEEKAARQEAVSDDEDDFGAFESLGKRKRGRQRKKRKDKAVKCKPLTISILSHKAINEDAESKQPTSEDNEDEAKDKANVVESRDALIDQLLHLDDLDDDHEDPLAFYSNTHEGQDPDWHEFHSERLKARLESELVKLKKAKEDDLKKIEVYLSARWEQRNDALQRQINKVRVDMVSKQTRQRTQLSEKHQRQIESDDRKIEDGKKW